MWKSGGTTHAKVGGNSWAWAYLHRRIHMGVGAYAFMGLGGSKWTMLLVHMHGCNGLGWHMFKLPYIVYSKASNDTLFYIPH